MKILPRVLGLSLDAYQQALIKGVESGRGRTVSRNPIPMNRILVMKTTTTLCHPTAPEQENPGLTLPMPQSGTEPLQRGNLVLEMAKARDILRAKPPQLEIRSVQR